MTGHLFMIHGSPPSRTFSLLFFPCCTADVARTSGLPGVLRLVDQPGFGCTANVCRWCLAQGNARRRRRTADTRCYAPPLCRHCIWPWIVPGMSCKFFPSRHGLILLQVTLIAKFGLFCCLMFSGFSLEIVSRCRPSNNQLRFYLFVEHRTEVARDLL